MDDFVSESDSDYTSYWRDWVSEYAMQPSQLPRGANRHSCIPAGGRCNLIMLFP